jgi:hypothetical protein
VAKITEKNSVFCMLRVTYRMRKKRSEKRTSFRKLFFNTKRDSLCKLKNGKKSNASKVSRRVTKNQQMRTTKRWKNITISSHVRFLFQLFLVLKCEFNFTIIISIQFHSGSYKQYQTHSKNFFSSSIQIRLDLKKILLNSLQNFLFNNRSSSISC